mgnify:CR=1 FL=1
MPEPGGFATFVISLRRARARRHHMRKLMRSIGIDLEGHLRDGLLHYIAARPTFYSLEMHLAVMLREIARSRPRIVVLDPISAFDRSGEANEIQTMLLRMVDYLKSHGVTGVFTHLTHAKSDETVTDAGLSSLMDAWILMLNREAGGEFNRELYLLKARGIQHSNQVREFIMSEKGLQLRTPYLGEGGALTGANRRAKEAEARRTEVVRAAEVSRLQQQVEQRRRRLEAQIEALRAEMAAEELELTRLIDAESAYVKQAKLEEDVTRTLKEGVATRE